MPRGALTTLITADELGHRANEEDIFAASVASTSTCLPLHGQSRRSRLAAASSFLTQIEYKPDPAVLEESVASRANDPKIEDIIKDWGKPKLMSRPSGRPLPCLRGTDYSFACPIQWTKSGAVCMPPSDFVFSERCLAQTGGVAAIPANMPSESKHLYESMCTVSWPCMGRGGGGVAPAYEELCPDDWQLQEDGTCLAPPSYVGPCDSRNNFLNYTEGMKEAWAHSCNASWPLKKTPPSLEGVEPSKPVDHAQPQAEAAWCKRHDYSGECPVGYRLDSHHMCLANGHESVQACSHINDTRRWSADMKRAFEKNCHVSWPCWGEKAGDQYAAGPTPDWGFGMKEQRKPLIFKLGDQVLARNGEDQLWRRGRVEQLVPLQVHLEDEPLAREFRIVTMPTARAPASTFGGAPMLA